MFEDHTSKNAEVVVINGKQCLFSRCWFIVVINIFVLFCYFCSLVIREMIPWCSALIYHTTDMRASISSQLFLII